jgi:hypothetical protein
MPVTKKRDNDISAATKADGSFSYPFKANRSMPCLYPTAMMRNSESSIPVRESGIVKIFLKK